MKSFLNFAKYAVIVCIFLNTALLVDGACDTCPLQGPPGICQPCRDGAPGISCVGPCLNVTCAQPCADITCTQSCAVDPSTCTQSCADITCTQSCDVDPSTCTQTCDVDPSTCTQSCADIVCTQPCTGIPCTQSCDEITCIQSCSVDPSTCTQSCADIVCTQPCDGIPCEQPCIDGASFGAWFVPDAPVIDVTTFEVVPFSVGEAIQGITNVGGTFTLANAGVYMVSFGICTVAGHEPFQLTLNGAPIIGGKIKAGLDEVIKPQVLTFTAPAGAIIELVNVSPGTASLGNSGAVGDPEVPAAYIAFLQIQ